MSTFSEFLPAIALKGLGAHVFVDVGGGGGFISIATRGVQVALPHSRKLEGVSSWRHAAPSLRVDLVGPRRLAVCMWVLCVSVCVCVCVCVSVCVCVRLCMLFQFLKSQSSNYKFLKVRVLVYISYIKPRCRGLLINSCLRRSLSDSLFCFSM